MIILFQQCLHRFRADLSHRALSREHAYPERYTEIEIFIPVEHTLAAFSAFRAFQKRTKKQRDAAQDENLGFGVYVLRLVPGQS